MSGERGHVRLAYRQVHNIAVASVRHKDGGAIFPDQSQARAVGRVPAAAVVLHQSPTAADRVELRVGIADVRVLAEQTTFSGARVRYFDAEALRGAYERSTP